MGSKWDDVFVKKGNITVDIIAQNSKKLGTIELLLQDVWLKIPHIDISGIGRTEHKINNVEYVPTMSQGSSDTGSRVRGTTRNKLSKGKRKSTKANTGENV